MIATGVSRKWRSHGFDNVGAGGVRWSLANPPFLFCAEFSGLTPPWLDPALYTLTACLFQARSGTHIARLHRNKTNSNHQHTHTNSQKSSTINGQYTPRYTATITVIHRKSQIMSDLQNSCILCHIQIILIIYRKVDFLHY